MKQFTIKQGDKVMSVVEHFNDGKVFVKEGNSGVFIKAINGFSYEVTDDSAEAGSFYNGAVENIIWYIMGSIDKSNGYEVEMTVSEEYK